MVDHALANGIRAYTAIAEQRWLKQVEGFGWRTKRLGPLRSDGATNLGALEIRIDSDTPKQVRATGIVPDDTLNDLPAQAAA